LNAVSWLALLDGWILGILQSKPLLRKSQREKLSADAPLSARQYKRVRRLDVSH
jgi:hypothetical protein